VRSIVQNYSNTEQFNVDPTKKTAQRILDLLKDIEDNLSADMSVEDLNGLLDKNLALLRAEHIAASGFKLLEPWIGGAVDELEQAMENATTTTSLANTSLPNTTLPGNVNAQINQESRIVDVMNALSIPRSVPPANSLQLRRTTEKAFISGADTALQIIGAAQPEFREVLPTALASVSVTPTSQLEVYAMRVKAAPYGSTVPKKSIIDSKGAVIGTQEWPIDGTQVIGISIDVQSEQLGPFRASLFLRRNDEQSNVSVNLSTGSQTETKVGDINVRFAPGSTYDDAQGLAVDLINLNRTFVFRHVDNDTVTFSTKAGGTTEMAERTILIGQTISLFVNQRYFNVSYTDTQFETRVFSVTEETPLPPTPPNVIPLDAPYEQITPGSWVAVVRNLNAKPLIRRVETTQTVNKTDYNFPAKVTQLELNADWLTANDLWLSDIRDTTVFAQSELLELAEEPIYDPICGGEEEDDWIELDGLYSELKSGRWLIVAGERADIRDADGNDVEGVKSAELVMLSAVKQDINRPPAAEADPTTAGGTDKLFDVDERLNERGRPGDFMHTFIKLAKKLAYCYWRDRVKIYGNVVKATHGETRNETLGSGDASRPLQSFTLRQPPLTHVSSPTPAGAASTLHVFVNNVEWHEQDALAGLEPSDHAFITRPDDEDKTTLIFGNGKEGARLPTGLENVRAKYRNGIGKPGNVKADQISLLVTRPLGVKDVINPLRASGGADRESRDQARANAPLAVMSLDRLVSVQDYADFTRTFAGIGKAVAARMSDGRRTLVHLTIAGADDIPIDPISDLYRNLLRALREYGSPDMPVRVDGRELLMLVISANIGLLPDYLWEPVVTEVRHVLLETLSFERRDLAQDVLLSEVISAVHRVEGVAYVDVDVLGGVPEKKTDETTGLRRLLTPEEITATVQAMLADQSQPLSRVVVSEALSVDGVIQPAQLAFLTPDVPDTLILNQIKID
jgi:hypothetical protein